MPDPSAFKAYDIRGIYPSQLDEADAYSIGRAYAQWLEPSSVAVGRDMRTMAASVQAELMRGLVDEGVTVIDIGLVATEVLYHAVAGSELDGGIMVTASHNPAEYIGMKVVRRGALPVGLDSGLDRVRDLVMSRDWSLEPAKDGGSITERDVLASWRERVLEFVDTSKIAPMTVVLDAGNGIGGQMFEPLLASMPGLTVHAYNFTPDGSFPNHEPNPLLEENRQFIISKVREHGAALGIAWDGDADRCFFIDEHGDFVAGDFTTALIARQELERHPGATVLYDVRASRAVADTITEAGGTALASRVGHAFIKQRMRKEDAVFAGEVSGHYYFRDYYGVDTGIVPALVMLQLVSEAGGSLARLVEPLRQRYHLSGEINSRVDDVPMKLQQIKEQYRDARISHIDGVSVDYDSWHFNVRPSNTEPLLRLCLEASSHDEMVHRRDEVLELIRSASTARIGMA